MIPLLYFHFKGIINKKNILTCYLILSLIILQGFVGWYMVESGLINNTTVSHYRLSVHLSIAFLIISIIFWVILNLKNNTHNYFFIKKKYNYFFYLLFILMSFQIIMGAFVSGLDAGKIYQTWPMMNYTYFPNDSIFNSLKDYLDFNNHGLVQFYHRNIAYLIFLLILTGGFVIFKKKFVRLYKSFCLLFLILLLQIFLGIFTLITGLNINMASAHQICGLLLILTTINLYYDYTN
jgi:cytochrome c oxidase assembly protein subunit 15